MAHSRRLNSPNPLLAGGRKVVLADLFKMSILSYFPTDELYYIAHAVKYVNGRAYNPKAQTLAINAITGKS